MRVYWTKWAVKLDRANNHNLNLNENVFFTNTLVEYNMLRLHRIGMLRIKHMEFKWERRRVNRIIGSIYRRLLVQFSRWHVREQIECHGFITHRENRSNTSSCQ